MKIRRYLYGLLMLFVFVLPINLMAEQGVEILGNQSICHSELDCLTSNCGDSKPSTCEQVDSGKTEDNETVSNNTDTSQLEDVQVNETVQENNNEDNTNIATDDTSEDDNLVNTDSPETNNNTDEIHTYPELDNTESENSEDKEETSNEDIIVNDEEGSTADISVNNTEPEKLIINEVMIGSEINNIKDVWIEFYNPTEKDIKLDQWKIKGVTKGGNWVEIVNSSEMIIKADGHFLFSYYSNSRSSALDIKPDMQKSSLFFPDNNIEIQIKDPNDNIVDTAKINHIPGEKFQSHERNLPITDGALSSSWSLASKQINLKEGLEKTFATPGSKNSLYIEDETTDTKDIQKIDNTDIQSDTTCHSELDSESSTCEQVDPGSESGMTEDEADDATENSESPAETITSPEDDQKTETPETTNPPSGGSGTTTNTDSTTESDESGETSPPPVTTSGGGGSSEPLKIIYPDYKLINEVMVNPLGSDTEGEWVELFNDTSITINLNGWYLDDAEGNSSPYRINNVSVKPKSYSVFSEPNLKLSFKNSSDQIRLLDPNKEAKEVITYFEAEENYTYAKKSNGEFEWTPIITPNAVNQFSAPLKNYQNDDVIFKSVLPNPKGTDGGHEKITLQNNLNEVITMDNWKIKNKNNREYLLKNIQLNAKQTFSFDPSQIKLTLTNTSDQLSLIDPKGNLIDRINWSNAKDDQIIYRSNYFQDGTKTKVEKVVDGDTFTATINDTKFNIRLIGVDTPETVDPKKPVEKFGQQATDYLKNLISNQIVTLNFDDTKTDIYNRPLAYVYLNDKFINAEIVKNGYGYAYTVYDFKYKNDFLTYEKEAKDKKLGLWSKDNVTEIQDVASDADDNLETEYLTEINGEEGDELDVSAIEDDEIVAAKTTTCHSELDSESSTCKQVDPGSEYRMTNLQIDSIVPNASIEYIKLVNKGKSTVNFKGWQLDDEIGTGSKTFNIPEGGMEPNAVRTFRKSETNITLNNSNDCANLIDPSGKIVDKICYTKTHKDEIFTHEGGNWVAKNKSSGTKKTTSTKTSNTNSSRSSDSYKWDLKNETLSGQIDYIYEEGEIIYLKTNSATVPVSYASSKINISMAKQLLDLKEPVLIDVHSTPDSKSLIGLKQAADLSNQIHLKNKLPIEIIYGMVILMVFGGLFVVKKKFV